MDYQDDDQRRREEEQRRQGEHAAQQPAQPEQKPGWSNTTPAPADKAAPAPGAPVTLPPTLPPPATPRQ